MVPGRGENLPSAPPPQKRRLSNGSVSHTILSFSTNTASLPHTPVLPLCFTHISALPRSLRSCCARDNAAKSGCCSDASVSCYLSGNGHLSVCMCMSVCFSAPVSTSCPVCGQLYRRDSRSGGGHGSRGYSLT